jgi:hypothetical protein
MRGVNHLNIFSEFLRTNVYRDFSATLDFIRFRNRWLARTPKIPAQDPECCTTGTLVLKAGRVLYHGLFIKVLASNIIYFL